MHPAVNVPKAGGKTEAQRAEKHRRIAHAKHTIDLLGNAVKPTFDSHIFKATPINGAVPDKKNPTGLHAYTRGADGKGKLPPGIEKVARTGNKHKVHTLTWRWRNEPGWQPSAGQPHQYPTKTSTMLPRDMPAEHARTLFALEYPEVRNVNVEGKELAPEHTKTYITHKTKIKLKKAGDTIYPDRS